jgi:hypothetical protein
MKITLAQAIDIRSAISKRIQELLNERNSSAVVSYYDESEMIYPNRKLEEVEQELNETRKDYLEIDQLINTQNLKKVIDWEDEKISIYTAIELAKQIQGEVNILKSMGSRKAIDTSIQYGSPNVLTTKALYNVEEYRQKSIELSKKSRLLSQTIQATNHKLTIDFSKAEKYI